MISRRWGNWLCSILQPTTGQTQWKVNNICCNLLTADFRLKLSSYQLYNMMIFIFVLREQKQAILLKRTSPSLKRISNRQRSIQNDTRRQRQIQEASNCIIRLSPHEWKQIENQEQKSIVVLYPLFRQWLRVNFKQLLAWGAKIGPVTSQPHLARWRRVKTLWELAFMTSEKEEVV